MNLITMWRGRPLVALAIAIAAVAATSSSPLLAVQDGALRVVVTIKPVHSLVAQVMAGLGTPHLLVDGNASPHAFALRPSDARALAGADVVVRVSASVEPFTVRIAETLGEKTQLITLAEAPGVVVLETRRGTSFEPHDHAHGHSQEHVEPRHGEHDGHDDGKHGHDAKAPDDADDRDRGAIDGHIWLEPDNAKAIVRHIARILAKLRPDLKEKLDANAAKAVVDIGGLDEELEGVLAPLAGKPFIVFHDAYQYFEHHFGLQAAGAITLNPEVKPSARRLAEIRDTLIKTGAQCVFSEPQFSRRILATVIEGTEAQSGTLDPLGVDIPAGSGHYAGLMRNLATAMSNCLAG